MVEKNFIIGYGSLIERESRQRTSPNATEVTPVRVFGFKRGWFARTGVEGLTTTFLGCVESKRDWLNGVVYEVSEKDLEETDLRERGYVRKKVEAKGIFSYTEPVGPQSNFWIYTNVFDGNNIPNDCLPSSKFPIVQSYVDICLNGCLQIDEKLPDSKKYIFSKDFITSTHFWSHFWVNDRIYPRRPFIHIPKAYEIDYILKHNLSDKSMFESMYFE